MKTEIEELVEKYMTHLENKGLGAMCLDGEDTQVAAALVAFSKKKLHLLAASHRSKTKAFIAFAPKNPKNYGSPDKSWLCKHQAEAGPKGKAHLQQYGFE